MDNQQARMIATAIFCLGGGFLLGFCEAADSGMELSMLGLIMVLMGGTGLTYDWIRSVMGERAKPKRTRKKAS